MIKQNKLKILISSVIILLPSVLGFIIPKESTTPFAFPILIPIFLLATHWLCIFVTSLDKGNKNQSKKVMGILYWIMPTISVYIHALFYLIEFGLESNLSLVIGLMAGIGFIIVGNVLPKSRRNRTVGIKIKWTLENDENWNATHRFVGKVWVVSGALITLCSLLPDAVFFSALFVIMLASVVLPPVYSYRYYKKQKNEGRYVKDDSCSFKPNHSRATVILTVIFIVIILTVCGVIMFTGDLNTECTENGIAIDASYHSDYYISYDDIVSVELRQDTNVGTKYNGFNSARLLMGYFKNDEFGSYLRYSYTKQNSEIIIKLENKTVVIGAESEEATEALYNEILTKIGG